MSLAGVCLGLVFPLDGSVLVCSVSIAGTGDREATATIESKIDPIAWKTELARVAPKLHVKDVVSTRTWRAHFEQAQKHTEVRP